MSVGVLITCGVLLTAAAILAMSRVERGPSMLDRIVAIDVMVAAIIGTLTILSAWSGRVDLVPVLMVLALVGFVGSVTLARFAAAEPEEERHILTPEEIAEADAKVRAELEEES